MSGASLEDTLDLWSAALRGAKERIRPLFAAPSVAASAEAFLDGLLGPERRTTGRMRAEAAGDPGPWRQQAVLGRSHWDADALRDVGCKRGGRLGIGSIAPNWLHRRAPILSRLCCAELPRPFVTG